MYKRSTYPKKQTGSSWNIHQPLPVASSSYGRCQTQEYRVNTMYYNYYSNILFCFKNISLHITEYQRKKYDYFTWLLLLVIFQVCKVKVKLIPVFTRWQPLVEPTTIYTHNYSNSTWFWTMWGTQSTWRKGIDWSENTVHTNSARGKQRIEPATFYYGKRMEISLSKFVPNIPYARALRSTVPV